MKTALLVSIIMGFYSATSFADQDAQGNTTGLAACMTYDMMLDEGATQSSCASDDPTQTCTQRTLVSKAGTESLNCMISTDFQGNESCFCRQPQH